MVAIPPDGYMAVAWKFESSYFVKGVAYCNWAYTDGGLNASEFAEAYLAAYEVNYDNQFFTDAKPTSMVVGSSLTTVELTVPEMAQRTGDHALPSTAVLHSFSGAGRDRRSHGRCFVPAMLKDQEVNDDGSIAAVRRAEIASAAGAFGEDLGALGIQQVILHVDSDLDPTIVIRGSIEPKVATQRRRLR